MSDKMFYAKDNTPKELDDFIDSLTGEQMRKIQGFFHLCLDLNIRLRLQTLIQRLRVKLH